MSVDHDEYPLHIKCFGDKRQFCEIELSSALDTSITHCVPLRIVEDGGQVAHYDRFKDTFLGKFLYVPKPCYIKCWISGKANVLWTSNLRSRHFALVQTRTTPFNESHWNTTEVLQRKPFFSKSMPYKFF